MLGPAGRIRVDANGLWSLDDAERALRALGRYDLEYAEQPVASIDDLARLRRLIAPLVPIAADESIRKASDPHAVLRAEAADVLILKFQPLGGLDRLVGIVDDAMAAGGRLRDLGARSRRASASARPPRSRAGVDEHLGREHDHGLGTAALLAADVTREPLLPIDGRIVVREVVPDPETARPVRGAPGPHRVLARPPGPLHSADAGRVADEVGASGPPHRWNDVSIRPPRGHSVCGGVRGPSRRGIP